MRTLVFGACKTDLIEVKIDLMAFFIPDKAIT